MNEDDGNDDESNSTVGPQLSSDNVGESSNFTDFSPTFNMKTLSKPSVRTRYDLSLKLYSTLVSRQGI
jgi:hypothetical protein